MAVARSLKKNLCVNQRGARPIFGRLSFVRHERRGNAPCLQIDDSRRRPVARPGAWPAENAPIFAQKRPTVPNWNSVNKKILAARCNIVYICVCGCNSAPSKQKAGLLWQ